MINWEKYRNLFPVVAQQTYFMTAGGGAISQPVLDAIQSRYQTVANMGGRAFGENIQIMERCREKIAKLINAEKEHIAFIPHVSFGMNALANSLPKTDSVLIAKNDFGSSVIPWTQSGHTIQWVDSLKAMLDALQNNTLDDVSTIVASSIHFGNGYKMPIDKIKESKPDVNLIVNGTQGIGAFPIDVKTQKIDALVCSCYKWMGCGEGIAFMYIHPDLFKQLKPNLIGWRSVEGAMNFDGTCKFYDSARIFELGWDNLTIFAGFDAALDLIEEIGIENIGRRILSLTNYLMAQLEQHNIPVLFKQEEHYRSGITLLGPFDNLGSIMSLLEEHNVWVTQREGGIRISLHYYNNEQDIDRLIEVLTSVV
ncbi:aminotransferase class V-fold PLP-dependent enzyme [Legionella waltersii]|uniref:Aminotransferase class V n=1 Tax=Legionella waltersii TaxID=66969 RepID=A0A0W1AM86_9GAMM|nr:aminotransferase class V-fold PLP-dependent enzyme [Legionella waltersii]KTD82368.1 aminotransferase class V [Legionella waltersii]SNV03670.1 aminotransferase class V [Legionella waltersii]